MKSLPITTSRQDLNYGIWWSQVKPIMTNQQNWTNFIFCHIMNEDLLLKRQTKIAADDILLFYFYLPKKIRLGFSCESSA